MTSSRLGQQLTLDFSATPLASPTQKSASLSAIFGHVQSPTHDLESRLPSVPAPETLTAATQAETPVIPHPPQQANPAGATLPESEPRRNEHNYRITEADHLGSGSLKARCRDNLNAIDVLKRIEGDDRRPTPAEKRLLVRYVGWGGLPQVFDPENDDWTPERRRIEQILTPDELESARATTLNAHYTASGVINAMYEALRRLGFSQGRILEPALGLGHFIGLMPDDMHQRSRITGIEIDSITARLARVLYPDADIRHKPFEESALPGGSFDVAIGNIPFGDYKPFDPRFKDWHFLIHDYFFAAALEKVRCGGLVLFITSKGTLDKHDATLREYVSQQADLIGAIRLPNDAFKKNANTEVTTDIIVLRKRVPGELPSGPDWLEVVEITNAAGETIPVNEYFAAHPEMMLGEMRLAGKMYARAEPTLVGNGVPLEERLAQAIALLPSDVFRPQSALSNNAPPTPGFPAAELVKPNAYTLVNEHIGIREGDEVRLLTGLSPTRTQRIRGMVRLRDALRRCLQAQVEDAGHDQIQTTRDELNRTYDRFVAKHGPVSERANASSFRGDPDLPLLLSLEQYDSDTHRATKASIFRERTIQPAKALADVNTAQDALLVTLGERGRVDLDLLSQLLHRKSSEFLPELKGAIFLNPQTESWETEDEYLSGNVRAKLKVAEAAAQADTQFKHNAEALKQVQPADLPASEIDARLGSVWIPADDVSRFAEELLGEQGITVSHAPQLGLWTVQAGYGARFSVTNTTEWGTDRRSAIELLEDALNLRTPTVYDHDPDSDHDVINPAATEAARDKQDKIKERFKQWIWQDDDRRERLARKYNDEFNCIRLRSFNGDHLRLPGASSAITLHPHQRAAVWRILQTPNCLLAHVVGAGKTYTMVAAAMELKRLGLARKPLFVVPNHMLGQFSSELLTLYPGANILVATKDDFEKNRRKTLTSRIATGNWDAVIMTHSGFEKIPVSRAAQEEFIKGEIRELSLAIKQQGQEHNSRIVKMLERARKRLETKLKELAAVEHKDDGLTFEELGVDRLFVDEAHYFKNLFYVSKMTRIAGLPQTASQRAFDMFLKVIHVQRQNAGAGVVFATGTPIANSVAEMFTMQRYLQLSALKALKLDHFDSWAATFGEPATAMELAPDGSGYRLNTRFARFINVPELMQQFRQVADIQTQETLHLSVPAMRGGKPTVISAPCSPELAGVVESLVERAEALKTGRIDPRLDNMLLVTTDGRKAALDLRLHDPFLPDHPDSKVNRAVNEIERIWRDTTPNRSTQLVFCDLSTPTGGHGFSVYEDVRDKLIARGILASEIQFIQDHESDDDKLQLFRDVRAGKVRILLGSTQKMGTGTNVQERLIALHHLDAPWRPADVEQREGRILRQGNTNPEVQIYRYVTEHSFDAYMWQTLETKARFIGQVMTGQSDLRRIEDIDGTALTYAEVKAIASGNPLVIEKAQVDAELTRLGRLRSEYEESRFKLRGIIRHLADEIPILERKREAAERDMAARQDTTGGNFVMTIDGQEIHDRGVAGELLLRQAERYRGLHGTRPIGSIAGFRLSLSNSMFCGPEIMIEGAGAYTAKVTDTAFGTIRSVEYTLQHLDEFVTTLAQKITSTQKQLADAKAQVEAPFEYAGRLASLSRRQQEIGEELALTKNQATSDLGAKSDEAPPDGDNPEPSEPSDEPPQLHESSLAYSFE